MTAERQRLLPWVPGPGGSLQAVIPLDGHVRGCQFPVEITVTWLNGHLKVMKAEMQVQPNRMFRFEFGEGKLFPSNKQGLNKLKIEAALSASLQAEELLCRLDELLGGAKP